MNNDSAYTKRILAIILILALLVRIGLAFVLGDQAEPISGAYDQISYDTLAQSVVSGRGFSFPSASYPAISPNTATAFWSFGYTLYLASVYAIFGHHPLAARLVQTLLSCLNVWLAYRLGRRLFGEHVGLAVAALTASYAYLIFFNAALMTQTFYILAVLAAINLSLSIAEESTRRGWVLLGLSIGLGALFRQTLFLFAPILFAYIWWRVSRNSRASHPSQVTRLKSQVAGFRSLFTVHCSLFTGTLLALAIIAALILPWTVRNYLVFHDFLLLNSNSGFWFYFSNHPDQGTSFDPNYVASIPVNLQGLTEPAMDRALLREAFGFVISDPQRFLLLSLNRTKDYFWLVPSEQSSLISNVSRLLSFTLYLPFMLYGLYLSRKNWRACLPLYLYAVFDTGLCLISWSAPRYRLPTDTLMMVFAGLAVVDLAERVGISKWLVVHLAIQNPKSPISNL